MGYYDFPHTRNYDTDLGYLIKQYLTLREKVETLIATQTINYADPLQWDITKQYAKNYIVVNGYNAYLSKQPVPAGILITNPDYWLVVGDFIKEFDELRENIANANNGVSPTLLVSRKKGDLIWWNDTLYICLKDIEVGTALVIGTNVKEITIEEYVKEKTTEVKEAINYTSAASIGIIADDETKGTENTAILNNALENGKVIFFNKGTYYFTGKVIVKNKAGIIGESVADTKLVFNGNGLDVPVTINDTDGVYSEVTIKNIRIEGLNNTGIGLHLYNYTFEITCNHDETRYKELKGDLYALEFRNSDITNLTITGFNTGIEVGQFVALVTLDKISIYSNRENGLLTTASDCIFTNMNIYFCLRGVLCRAGNNKFSNIKVFMCGNGFSYSPAEIALSVGIQLENFAHECQLSNVEVQENYNNGIIFNNVHDLNIDVIADANGFGNKTGVGCQFLNCQHINGNLVSCNKNAVITQRLGLYCDSKCKDFNLNYTESNQLNSVYTAGESTYNLINIGRNNDFVKDNSHGECMALIERDVLYLSCFINGSVDANTQLLDMTNIFPVAYGSSGYIMVSGFDYTNNTIIKFRIDNKKLINNDPIPASANCTLNTTVRLYY